MFFWNPLKFVHVSCQIYYPSFLVYAWATVNVYKFLMPTKHICPTYCAMKTLNHYLVVATSPTLVYTTFGLLFCIHWSLYVLVSCQKHYPFSVSIGICMNNTSYNIAVCKYVCRWLMQSFNLRSIEIEQMVYTWVSTVYNLALVQMAFE